MNSKVKKTINREILENASKKPRKDLSSGKMSFFQKRAETKPKLLCLESSNLSKKMRNIKIIKIENNNI